MADLGQDQSSQMAIRARYDFIAQWHDAIGRFTMTHRRLKVIPSYREALDEEVRVLEPEGVLVVLDGKLSRGVSRFLDPLTRWMARGPMTDLARPLADEIARRVRFRTYIRGHWAKAIDGRQR